MRYISHHHKTISALKEWSGTTKLVMASFYFWNLGPTLQKSQLGLLKSLLYQILQEPVLIQPTFADIWPIINGVDQHVHRLSFVEAKRAFCNLIMMRDLPIKICLFVDGLDGFDGDCFELATPQNEISYQW